MEPQPEGRPTHLESIEPELFDRAISIYLEHAYRGGPVPEAVRRRLDRGDATGPMPLDRPPFERVSPPRPDQAPVYALRLGNALYPHMKLQIQPWPCPAGFLLSVNTHDQITPPDPGSPEAEGFRALQAENRRFKQEIEDAWDAAGLPTFLRYLRDFIRDGGGGAPRA